MALNMRRDSQHGGSKQSVDFRILEIVEDFNSEAVHACLAQTTFSSNCSTVSSSSAEKIDDGEVLASTVYVDRH
ncbi:hypothetical protein BIW11_11481 [Tropilaelaps mercedesae]|uniref:Uncharacterized protein n=1 Tax=Tropilaelaps mercedesae TaxID=418985 RepID=A0A1V9XAV6_9ACAR|nr:hypothetical protein BIW11_11481 [Tropilaelaps mercedesae]